MDISFLFFVSSGLFLGWSLGANDAANIFGTAVGTRMIRFITAATICSVFVLLGAVISGGGTSETIASFGGVNRIAGSFIVALAAALAVFFALRSGVTASTSQAIIGSLIGWNLYSSSVMDTELLLRILSTWVLCPLLAGIVAVLLTLIAERFLLWRRPHLLTQDALTRIALILTGALGAYALGANNIGNVMGVFVEVSPFRDIESGQFSLSATQQLFMLGGLAIAMGVFTYSRRVMMTIGNGVMDISPIAAWIIVCAHSIVLLMFSSRSLEQLLSDMNLPTLPLVPVSSSQAVIGALVGLALLKGGKAINWHTLKKISLGWLVTPASAALLSLTGLFLMEHIGEQPVYASSRYVISETGFNKLEQEGIETWRYRHLAGVEFHSPKAFINKIESYQPLSAQQRKQLLDIAYLSRFELNHQLYRNSHNWLSTEQWQAVQSLKNQQFSYRWQLRDALAALSPQWRYKPDTPHNRSANRQLQQQLTKLERLLEINPPHQ
ncbi:inorganic phosphate transporter [Oceanospirillum sp. D5]|uniref:Phosphate transporter n=2 Tax=Oceanospirillum sediminis TaxID=2760088 RepID=A0A839ILQ1_9GAMM|nr:inorganic phosphate transporter [Oceanospirillum sediminis]